MRRFALILTLAIVVSLFWGTAAFAHGTGLNTIPTTEVLDEGVFEWDLDLAVSDEVFAGGYFSEDGRFLSQEFYACLYENLEVGFAFNGEREIGPFRMFGKYQVFDEEEGKFPLSLAVGIDNVIGTHDRVFSKRTYYGVVGKSFDRANAYLGFAVNASTVTDDNSVFGGFDYAFNDDWTFRFDYYGYDSNEEGVISGGFDYAWINHIDWRGWASYDTYSENIIWVVEFALMGRFDDLEAEV